MKSIKVEFKNNDGQILAGKVELPGNQEPIAYAIFAHCFTCSKNLNTVRNISLGLTRNGIGVLRFDFTGLGDSDGDFSETNFSSNIDDLLQAAEYLKEHYEAPELIIGHSLGGAAVLRTASKIDSVKAVATIGAPFDPPHVKKLLSGSIEEITSKGEAEVSIGGRPFKIKKQFIDDLERYDSSEEIKKLNRSLLIIHSPQDTTVGIENAGEIFDAAMHPKSFVSLDGADHLVTNDNDSIYVGQVISSWAMRYIETSGKKPLKAKNQVSVKTGRSYLTEIAAGNHQFLADEPESVGGTDLGPNPYDFLLSALGACTSMTLRMYADHKQLPLEEVSVHLSHNKVHKTDCEDCDNKGAKIDKIERTIELEGDLTQEQRQRMLEIADRCPVHKTLHNEIVVESRLKEKN